MVDPIMLTIVKLLSAVAALSFAQDSGRPKIPQVLLSKSEEPLCKVKVGGTMPAIKLPRLESGEEADLATLYGKAGTVVVFWKGDRRMAHQQLADIGPDVIEPYGEAGVTVVGIAVNQTPESAKAALEKNSANFPNLLDADGKGFAQVGRERLPRTYLLDPQGKILWFDFEYSNATRRELQQAVRALTGIGETAAAAAESSM
jgi:peroxiredoxin